MSLIIRDGHFDLDEPERPDADDLPHTFWECERCGAENSMLDAECQWCDPPEQREDDARTDYIVDRRKHGDR